MAIIYHLVTQTAWGASPEADYRAASLATEGFIHCSHAEQVAGSANRFYATASDLLVLHIDPARLLSPCLDEPASSGELFPHIHGPLNRTAVLRVEPLTRNAGGRWEFRPM